MCCIFDHFSCSIAYYFHLTCFIIKNYTLIIFMRVFYCSAIVFIVNFDAFFIFLCVVNVLVMTDDISNRLRLMYTLLSDLGHTTNFFNEVTWTCLHEWFSYRYFDFTPFVVISAAPVSLPSTGVELCRVILHAVAIVCKRLIIFVRLTTKG